MAFPHRFAALSNTPQRIASGARGEVQVIEARNPHASDGAYVKLYELAGESAPTGSTTPRWSGWVAGATARSLPVFADGNAWWIAVATEAGAGLSAPTTAFEVSLTFQS